MLAVKRERHFTESENVGVYLRHSGVFGVPGGEISVSKTAPEVALGRPRVTSGRFGEPVGSPELLFGSTFGALGGPGAPFRTPSGSFWCPNRPEELRST